MKVMVMCKIANDEVGEVLCCERVLETAVGLWILTHEQDNNVLFSCVETYDIVEEQEGIPNDSRMIWAWTGKGRWHGKERFRVYNF